MQSWRVGNRASISQTSYCFRYLLSSSYPTMAAIMKQLPGLVEKAKPKLNTFLKYAKVQQFVLAAG
jgi:hypothetical protein